MKLSKLTIGITAALFGAALFSGAVFAKGKPPPTEEGAQNLSVPAILVGSLGTLVCGADEANVSDLVPPTAPPDPQTGYEIDPAAFWWVQKVHTWQAQCFNATAASVIGNWGDNLAGDAKLKVGSPIRVEIVLTNSAGSVYDSLAGYRVLKLQPSQLDRLSAYGHDAVFDEVAGVWLATEDAFLPPEWVVHDAGMQISVQNLDTGEFAVPLQPIAPEINATGKIVYGYNLRVSAVGQYEIRFASTPAVTFTGVDAGEFDANNAYLTINVVAGGGGGGGRK